MALPDRTRPGLDITMPAKDRVLNRYLDIDVSKPQDEVEKDPGLEVFYCPGDREGDDIIFINGDEYETAYIARGNSYETNGALLVYKPSGVYEKRPLSKITVSFSKLYLVIDYPGFHGGEYPHARINVLFLDGHVKMHHWDDDFDWLMHPDDYHDPSKDVYHDPTPGDGSDQY